MSLNKAPQIGKLNNLTYLKEINLYYSNVYQHVYKNSKYKALVV